MSIYDAATKYNETSTDLIVIAGKEYGSGSSRDWAAKGTSLLGVRAVIAESFERIHRSNLIGLGVLPLTFKKGQNVKTLKLKGDELFSINQISEISPRKLLNVIVKNKNETKTFEVIVGIDTITELEYFNNGGILQYVLRKMK